MFRRERRNRRNWLALGAGLLVALVTQRPSSNAEWAALETPPAAPLAHEWQLVEGRHWQIASTHEPEDPAVSDAHEGTRGNCPLGMVEVDGLMVGGSHGRLDAIDELQRPTCVDWIDQTFPERCARFDRPQWLALSASLPREPMHFCIDRFEYPNRRGAYPWIMVDFFEARNLCARDGKRLCTEAEWTFACEGEEAMPYPYGYDRGADVCVIDRPWREVNEVALLPRESDHALREIDRLWQGEASGTRPRCRSPFGVYDMTGNVDEWTTSVQPGERPSIFKGGYWGPVRARCRPSTRVHGEDFAFYQQGLRCCGDLPEGPDRLRAQTP
ncbi:MAG TPA: SUMF1/EgtB/PvdO family nonheme iron enzyme [Polyangiaceae bacterium]|nr:SUMF1/EgtB/PvdO family nonheme iron enzyme [Polyangiaceae bacterium]